MSSRAVGQCGVPGAAGAARSVRRSGRGARVMIALLLGSLAGCAATTIPGASPSLLAFLKDGASTRAEIMLRLGQPSAALEEEKFLFYRVGGNEKKGFYVVRPYATGSWGNASYSLVLVFDSGGLLQKHRLVPVQ